MSILATKRVQPASLTCPYCRDHLQTSDDPSTCADCSTAYHLDCLSELGRCGTLGCSGLEAPSRGCLRCAQPINDQDLVLRCDGCERLCHRDCYIPGANCTAPKCGGTVEFVKRAGRQGTAPDASRCRKPGCRRPATGVGFESLGSEVRALCREHGMASRTNTGTIVITVFGALATALLTSTAASAAVPVLLTGLVLTCPFAIDAWRIERSKLPPR